MIKVLLACGAGMSSSLLLSRINKEINESELDIIAQSVSSTEIENFVNDIDVLLLGPQLAHLFRYFKKEYEPYNIAVGVISISAYGNMDGKSVASQIVELNSQRRKIDNE